MTHPSKIKTVVKFPPDVDDVKLVYEKVMDHSTGQCLEYVTTALIRNSITEEAGFGVSVCNTEKDNPSKRTGRNKALGRAVADYLKKHKE